MTTWMNRIAVAAIAATLGAGAITAQAQPQPRGNAPEARHDNRDQRASHAAPQRNNHPMPQRQDNRAQHDNRGHDAGPHRGAGPDHRWVKGSRVPQQYRSNSYVVNDWRGHRLSAPPRGYHWIQNGGDYVMVAIATGIVAQIILGN